MHMPDVKQTVYPVLDGSAFSGIENPLDVMAQSILGFDNTRITNSSDLTEGIFIKNVTQCAFTFCVSEYNVHVTNGAVFMEKSSPDFGKVENLTGPEFEGKSSSLCWAPSQIPNDTERHYDILYQDSAMRVVGPDFTFCDLDKYGQLAFGGVSLLAGSTFDTCVREESGWEYGQRTVSLDTVDRVLDIGLEGAAPRVADSLTKALLQNSNVTIPGSIYANQVIVRVQWAWMIFPTLLVILGSVFLVWTTCASRKKSIWKSSVLAFLFHGLEDQRGRDDCMISSGMEKLAETMHVQLHPSRDDARVMLREN